MDRSTRPCTFRRCALIVPALAAPLLVHCGIWPDFPARDSAVGTDVGIDVPIADANDVVMPMDGHGMDVPHTDAGMDITDIGPDAPTGGFDNCTAPSASTPFTVTILANVPAGTRDFAFDGIGHIILVGNDVERMDSSGSSTPISLATGNTFGGGLAVRMNAAGMIMATTGGAGVNGALDRIDPTLGTVTTVSTMPFNFPASLSVHGSGVFFVSDTFAETVYRVTNGGAQSTLLTMTMLHPQGLALTPDGQHLFVASQLLSNIYEQDLTTDGMAMSMPRVYASDLLTGSAMAFDHCGYLYVSDRDRNHILRVKPGGGPGSVETLTLTLPTWDSGMFLPTSVAFGHGTSFDTMSLYVLDIGHEQILKVSVGVAGASIVGP